MSSAKSLILGALLSVFGYQAEASYLKVDFSIDSSRSGTDEYSYGTPFGYPDGPITLAGTVYLIPGVTSSLAFAELDLVVGSKHFSAADIDRSSLGSSVDYNIDDSLSQFGIVFKSNGYLYSSNTIYIGDNTRSFYCNDCVAIDNITSVDSISTVPLPASAPLFGAALLVLGGLAHGLNRRDAARAERPAA